MNVWNKWTKLGSACYRNNWEYHVLRTPKYWFTRSLQFWPPFSCQPNASSVLNECDFRGNLKLRILSGDVTLENYLKYNNTKATYSSRAIQNKLIECNRKKCYLKILKILKKLSIYAALYLIMSQWPLKCDQVSDVLIQKKLLKYLLLLSTVIHTYL